MRQAYEAQWYADHAPKLGQEPIFNEINYRGHDWDDMTPHIWNFFQAVKSRQPVVEDAVFGNNAAVSMPYGQRIIFPRQNSYLGR